MKLTTLILCVTYKMYYFIGHNLVVPYNGPTKCGVDMIMGARSENFEKFCIISPKTKVLGSHQ